MHADKLSLARIILMRRHVYLLDFDKSCAYLVLCMPFVMIGIERCDFQSSQDSWKAVVMGILEQRRSY